MAERSTLLSLCRRFASLGAARRALLVEAAAELGWARIRLTVYRFERVAEPLGRARPPGTPAGEARPLSQAEAAIVREVGWAVQCAARRVPFEAACLPQALAAKRMLARRSIPAVLHFGVRRGDDRRALEAHAWVDTDGIAVTGYPVASGFSEVARFC